VGLWAGRSVRFYLELKEMERGADRVFAGSLDIINFVARMLIWSLLILVALDNLGVNITALLAGLGVGGVAVALALQGGIPEHLYQPRDGGAQRVPRRLCGPSAQGYGQKKNPDDSPGESAKGGHAMSPLAEGVRVRACAARARAILIMLRVMRVA